MVRLFSIYWKISSLLAISLLLLTDQRPIGYITAFIAPLIMVLSIWFWVDLNEELADLPPWRPLPFTVRFWRWSLSGFGFLASILSITSLACVVSPSGEKCLTWLEPSTRLHNLIEQLFQFLFGGQWTEGIAGFVGYIALIAYVVGLLQWSLLRLPKQGRIAGDF